MRWRERSDCHWCDCWAGSRDRPRSTTALVWAASILPHARPRNRRPPGSAARKAGGDDLVVMVDYNQSLDVPEAVRRGRLLDHEGIGWIEEPTIADDFAGHAQI